MIVDFPQPDAPTKATLLPGSITKLIFFKITWLSESLYLNETFLN